MAGRSDIARLLCSELQDFLNKHLTTAAVDIEKSLDDVVLGYLADIIISKDQNEDETFDQFMEIITEYISDFIIIERSTIYEWFITLIGTLSQSNEDCDAIVNIQNDNKRKNKKKQQVSDQKPKQATTNKSEQDIIGPAARDVSKDYILARYSQVAKDQYCHHPVLPKEEPKKMVRYRDNQVVSTKGERYTLQKTPETEEMKKTYVNLKPLRKYRFH